jgi:hypothetical protein
MISSIIVWRSGPTELCSYVILNSRTLRDSPLTAYSIAISLFVRYLLILLTRRAVLC